MGLALYREAELHRLRDEFAIAEEAYREASRRLGAAAGTRTAPTRPGDREGPAVSTIRRVLDETTEPSSARGSSLHTSRSCSRPATLRPRRACVEFEDLAEPLRKCHARRDGRVSRGAVISRRATRRAGLAALRAANDAWQLLEARYEVARTRELVGLACRALGDDEAAKLELEARAKRLCEAGGGSGRGARGCAHSRARASPHGLTPRELEVLRLVASGKSNRAIATELVISEHTVARHVQNIFAKLGVSSRTAAVSFAFERELF